jgi:hypothetical protein
VKNDDGLLDDLAPKRKERVVRKKKFHSNKGVTAEVAARRSAAAEAAQENPLPKLQKDAILMKYGVIPAVIERDIKMPRWKSNTIFQLSERTEAIVWNSMMQDWFKATKGLVVASRQRSSGRGFTTRPSNLPYVKTNPYPKRFSENLRNQPRLNKLS